MKPNSRRTQRGLGARSCNSQLAAAAKGRQRGSHATMPSETAPLPLLFVTSCFLFHTRKLTVPADGLPPALLPHRAASVGARVCSDSGEVCRRWVCRCKPPVLPLPPHPAASLPLPAGAQVKLRGAAGAGLACRGGPELALPACPCRHRRPVPPRAASSSAAPDALPLHLPRPSLLPRRAPPCCAVWARVRARPIWQVRPLPGQKLPVVQPGILHTMQPVWLWLLSDPPDSNVHRVSERLCQL